MAAVSDFPTSVTASSITPGYRDFAVQRIEYEDQGFDTNLDGKATCRTWAIEFLFLSEAQAAVLDGHFMEAKSSDGEFVFLDPYTDLSYAGVRYELEEYKAERHLKSWAPIRKALLFQELC